MIRYGLVMTGRQLGHYQILERLGQGGMGVVYKAHDIKLNRNVALKVLPADGVAGDERTRRFIHEARAASALNHPNIITVHEIGQADGLDFIVMEFVSGRTLEAVIDGKGMLVAEALRCAAQMADALAAAHKAGIVHRDLKPANVMITDSGLVKVVDFGLAKVSEGAGKRGSDETETVSEAGPLTAKGTIIGTVSYMSPEQAQGLPLDGRSDIFSFGSVLYEMVTGQRAFPGETNIDKLSAILRQEPRSVRELNAALPTELERVIVRCLRKDPSRRFQHMEDLKVALDELREESDSGKLPALAAARPSRTGIARLVLITAAVVALAAGAWWWSKRRPGGSLAEPVLTRLTSDSGLTAEPSLSPDGKLIAYSSDRAGEGSMNIWIQEIGGGEARRLTKNSADDREPSFSQDGGSIVFSSEREGGGVYVISTVGGVERKIAERGYRPRFSPDGRQVAYWVGDRAGGGFTPSASAAFEVHVVPAAGGPDRKVQGDLTGAWMPVWSPDGTHLLVQGTGRTSAGQARVLDWWVVPSGGSGVAIGTGAMDLFAAHKLHRTTGGDISLPLLAPELWLENQVLCVAGLGDSFNIWGIDVSPRDFKAQGVPVRLTNGVAAELNPSLWQGADKTRLVFSSQSSNVNIWGFPLDADEVKSLGEPRPLTDSISDEIRPAISADSRLLAFNANRSGTSEIWVKDLQGGSELVLTPSTIDARAPRFSPDGQEVIYTRRENEKTIPYLISTRGGLSRKIGENCQAFPWARRSRSVLCFNAGGLSLLNVDTGQRRQITTSTVAGAVLSSDDRWMACYRAAEQPGRSRVYAVPVREDGPTPPSEWVPITSGEYSDFLSEFSPDGKVVYFMSQRDGFGCLWAQRLEPASKRPSGPPIAVHHFHSARRSPGSVRAGQRGMSISRKMLVSTIEERTGNIWMAERPR